MSSRLVLNDLESNGSNNSNLDQRPELSYKFASKHIKIIGLFFFLLYFLMVYILTVFCNNYENTGKNFKVFGLLNLLLYFLYIVSFKMLKNYFDKKYRIQSLFRDIAISVILLLFSTIFNCALVMSDFIMENCAF